MRVWRRLLDCKKVASSLEDDLWSTAAIEDQLRPRPTTVDRAKM